MEPKKRTKKPGINRLKVNEETLLMPFLLSNMGGMSRNAVKQLLTHRQVMVDKRVCTRFDEPLQVGQEVSISSSRGNIELKHPKLSILFEDEFILVVDKKEGLLTVSTGREEETTAFSILKNYIKKESPQNRIYIVHRIDRETSGVLVFAKIRDMQLELQEFWHEIVTRREYVALVEGKVEKPAGTIKTWLTENEKSLKIHSSPVDNGGKLALTHYKRLKFNDTHSLLQLSLETGRKNQIRVHLAGIGHPISGDKKYGSDQQLIGRMGLHARTLAFIHPATRTEVCFESPLPSAFNAPFKHKTSTT